MRSDIINDMTSLPPRVLVLLGAVALAVAGCGSSSSSSTTSKATSTSSQAAATKRAQANAAQTAVASCRPPSNPPPATSRAAHGRSLTQLGALVKSSAQFGGATGTFTPGTRRVAFAVNTGSGGFVYAPTAIYVAKNPKSPAQGPFLAPADPMVVAPQYRSKQNAGPGGIQAIYSAQIPLPHAGTYTVLALTKTPNGLVGSPGEVAVAKSSPIPDVGQRPPAVATDTPASVHGDTALLTTRLPAENMHSVSLNQVLGKRPVALLFSTPQLCISKVCGPVTDIAVSLQKQFAGKIDFIHQEVYVDNQPSEGTPPPAQGVPSADRAVVVHDQPPGRDHVPARGCVRGQRSATGAAVSAEVALLSGEREHAQQQDRAPAVAAGGARRPGTAAIDRRTGGRLTPTRPATSCSAARSSTPTSRRCRRRCSASSNRS